MSLRTQVLLGLAILVGLAVLSVGTLLIAVSAHALANQAAEDASRSIDAASRAVGAALGDASLDDPGARARAIAVFSSLASAAGADELLLVDDRGRTVTSSDGRDKGSGPDPRLGLALAGAPPFVLAGSHLVAYGSVASPSGRLRGGVRLGFARDRGVGPAIRRARAVLLALGVIDVLVLVLVGTWVLRRTVIAPITALATAAQRVAAGDLDVRVAETGVRETSQLARAFNRMTESLEKNRSDLAERQEQLLRSEKLASVGRLAAGVAHEIGNPLASILGYSDYLLGQDELPKEASDIVERVRNETRRIHHIIQDLLAFARPGEAAAAGGRSAEQPGGLSLREVVDDVVTLSRPQARFHGVEVVTDLPAELPRVRAEPGRLRQVLLNLLLNAADAVATPGTAVRRIRIEASAREREVDLAIVDSGPGIPAEVRPHVFDPFFTTKEPGAGTGLGLPISSALVADFGGRLTLAPSGAGEGARFVLTLLRAPVRDDRP